MMPARRLIVRCDGDDRVGAGHVARCLPLAAALRELGWTPTFSGRYAGLAAWLLERAGMPTSPGDDALSGADAAIVDSYDLEPAAICALAERVPLVTPAEARRCEHAGTWLDYHADRHGEAPIGRVLPGPEYAPVDPRFAGSGRPGEPVRTALVTVGGSVAARTLVPPCLEALRTTFPGVRILLASGADWAGEDTEALPFPGTLLDVVGRVDLAVTGAGMTAYELAAAGVPMQIIKVADNQTRVVDGFFAHGLAASSLAELVDPGRRRAYAEAAHQAIDGRGAARAARLLHQTWTLK
jgi:spore coat polysaccharide biosynthesis predicted glycosyltransferase SpsG